MAQVPYKPTVDVDPGHSAGVDVPAGAFGEKLAGAIEGAGRDIAHAGDEIWNRAVDMQKEKINADVNEAVTRALMETGEADNKFRLMTGDDPQKNLEEHKATLEGINKKWQSTIPSTYGKNKFDAETRRRLSYDVVNAGNYSATELKKYNNQTYEAKQLAVGERAARDPNNMLALKTAVEDNTKSEKELAANEAGVSVDTTKPPANPLVQSRIERKVGKLIGDVAAARAIRDPKGAENLLENMKEWTGPDGTKYNMPSDIYQKTLETVTQRKIQYLGAVDAQKFSGATVLPPNHPVTQASDAINRIAEQWGPGTSFTPENIYRLVQQESRGQNLPPNQYGYTGYFQMKPSEFGMTPADFKNMSFEQQLELYANSYLKKYKYTGTQDLGVMNAAPAFSNATDSTVAYPPGSKEAAANPSWVRYSAAGGAVTVGGIKAWAEAGSAGVQRSPDISLPDVAARAAEKAKTDFPGDDASQAKYIEQVLSNAQRNYSLMRSQVNQQKQANRNAIDEVLFRVGPGDRGPVSWEDAERLRPGFQDLVTKAAETNPSIVKHINDTFSYNSKQDVDPTPERDARYMEYLGLSYGLNSGDRERFLNTNVTSLDLTRGDTRKLYQKQLDIQKQLQDTSKLRSAMYTVGPLLNEAKIYNSRTSTAQAAVFNTFQGGFLEKLQEFETKEKRFPNEQEQIALASTMLRKMDKSWYQFGPARREFQVPDGKKTEIINTFKERYNGREPNSMEIGQIYQRMQGAKD